MRRDHRSAAVANAKEGEPDGRLIGVGFASYTEQTAHGAANGFAAAPDHPGCESCTAPVLPDGSWC